MTSIVVRENGHPLAFSFDDMLRYSGPGSPGGVAVAFKLLECALPLVEPDGAAERRQVTVETSFGGPGARDGVELVTRALTDGRYTVDGSLARPERGRGVERFVFRLGYGGRTTTLLLREGYVTEEFVDLAGLQSRDDAEEAHLDQLKAELAQRVMAAVAVDVFDVE